MRINVWRLCLTTCLAVAATVEAQPGGGRRGGGMGGRGGIFSVATNEAVQKDLGLSSDVTSKVKEVSDEYVAANREGMSGITFGRDMSAADREKMASVAKANNEKFLPELKAALTADQFTRLRQINWQSQGAGALADPEVVKALAITKDQSDKIKTLTDDYAAKTRELFTGGGGGGSGGRDALTAISKERDEKINEVLTKDQVDKFASLKGKEFDVAQLRGGFGRGGGGGGGGAGANNNGGDGGARPKRPQPKAE